MKATQSIFPHTDSIHTGTATEPHLTSPHQSRLQYTALQPHLLPKCTKAVRRLRVLAALKVRLSVSVPWSVCRLPLPVLPTKQAGCS